MQRGGTSARKAVVYRGVQADESDWAQKFRKDTKRVRGRDEKLPGRLRIYCYQFSAISEYKYYCLRVYRITAYYGKPTTVLMYSMPTHRGYPLKQVSQGVADSSEGEGGDLQICMNIVGSRINKTLPVGVCMAVVAEEEGIGGPEYSG